MNWDAIAAFADSLAAVGVILSLGYVGYQVSETKKALKASVAQARTDLGVQLITSRYTSNIADLLAKSNNNYDDLGDAERIKLKSFFSAHVRHSQNMFYQQRQGLLDDYFHHGVARVVTYWIRNYEWAQKEWKSVISNVPPEFAEFIEDELGRHSGRYEA